MKPYAIDKVNKRVRDNITFMFALFDKVAKLQQITGLSATLAINISKVSDVNHDRDPVNNENEILFWKSMKLYDDINDGSVFSIFYTEEMTSKDCCEYDSDVQTVYLIRIRQKIGESFNIIPGQSFGIIPPQPIDLVSAFLNRLGITDHYKQIRVTSSANSMLKSKIPSARIHEAFLQGRISLSILEIFTFLIDLYSFPKKSMLRTLAEYCSDISRDRKCLYYLSSKDGSDEYRSIMLDFQNSEKRSSMLNWLELFPSCNPSYFLFIEHLPFIKPRYYSTTSCENNSIEFCFNVQPSGLCSKWLKEKVDLFSQGNQSDLYCFKKPFDIQNIGLSVSYMENAFYRPWIMIATGTGISPMISMINAKLNAINDIWLVYGCRYRKVDFLFKDRLVNWGFQEECSSALYQMDIVCSRDVKTHEKRYVQHLLIEKKEQLLNWIITRDAIIFVCGNKTGMIQAVHDTFIQILSIAEIKEPKKTLLEWSNIGKYKREVWAL